jgi:hypothetical protein
MLFFFRDVLTCEPVPEATHTTRTQLEPLFVTDNLVVLVVRAYEVIELSLGDRGIHFVDASHLVTLHGIYYEVGVVVPCSKHLLKEQRLFGDSYSYARV